MRCTAALTALVNNAGGQYPSPLAMISAKGWDAVVRNNLTGGFLMARECFTQWMARPRRRHRQHHRRHLVGMPGMGHSGAARAGMLNFTETAALEWAPVRVNAVAPGWIASSGMDQYPPEMGRADPRACTSSVPAAPPWHRERGLGGHHLPAVSGGAFICGAVPAGRRRGAATPSASGPQVGDWRRAGAVRRLPPGHQTPKVLRGG